MFFNEQLLVSFVGVSLLSLNENIAKWKLLLSSKNRHVTLKKKRWPHILVFYQGGPARPKLCLPSALVCFSIPKQNTGISRGKKIQKSRFLGESCKVDYYHKKTMATQINKAYIQTRLGSSLDCSFSRNFGSLIQPRLFWEWSLLKILYREGKEETQRYCKTSIAKSNHQQMDGYNRMSQEQTLVEIKKISTW